jgi:hypothetical protein
VYPEITNKVSESWQAEKYTKEIPDDQLTPMWADWKKAPHKHFYVHEIAQLKDDNFVLPLRWIVYEKTEHFEFNMLSKNEVSLVLCNQFISWNVETNLRISRMETSLFMTLRGSGCLASS